MLARVPIRVRLTAAFTILPFYAAGMAIAAQGQIQLAVLDTAVNSSRFLSDGEVERILRKRSLI